MQHLRARSGILASTLAALSVVLSSGTFAAPASSSKPNVVLIITDDEDVGIHAFMPKTKALIEDRGATFTNFFVSYPFCCPSRASILRGQYGHNTNVLGNTPPWGGFEGLRDQGLQKSTLATWLSKAGYHTAMVGKYINRYAPERHGVPPGWSDWYVGGNAHKSYDYVLNENGRMVHYGSRPQDYLNDVLTEKSVGIIRRAAAADEPFFLYVLPYTPHSPSVAAPRHEGMFADAPLPRTPAFDEADMSDKPALMQRLPRVDQRRLAQMEEEYRKRLRSLQAIDDMVERIVDTLEAAGILDETYVIYSSDNGFHIGEHRMNPGKVSPYEEDIRVPMVMRGPGVPEGARIDALAVNIDLAPTIAAIAGVEPPDFVDGRSFLPLLENPAAPWRRSFITERRQHDDTLEKLAAANGASEEELEQSSRFDGLRTQNLSYIEYGTGEVELYDLSTDPHQLDNIAPRSDPDMIAALSQRLSELAACAGAECRRLEDLPVGGPQVATGAAPGLPAVPATLKK